MESLGRGSASEVAHQRKGEFEAAYQQVIAYLKLSIDSRVLTIPEGKAERFYQELHDVMVGPEQNWALTTQQAARQGSAGGSTMMTVLDQMAREQNVHVRQFIEKQLDSEVLNVEVPNRRAFLTGLKSISHPVARA